MALTVEDGSGLAGANSYGTVADARSYASARGVTLPTDDADVETLLIKAMDWIESLRDQFKGWKTSDDQALQWPRYEVYVDRYYVNSDTIPRELRNAQMAAAMELHEGNELQPNDSGTGPVTKESVGSVSVEYATGARTTGPTAFAKPYALLAPLLRRNGMTVVRS